MPNRISLKQAERHVFRLAVQDGLWDILIGCTFLPFVVAPFLSPALGDFWSSAILLPFWGLLGLAIWLVRKHVLAPRLGTVRFSQARTNRLKRFSGLLFALLVAGFILGIVASLAFRSLSGWMFATLFGLITLLFFGAAGYFMDYSRLYLYGVLSAVSPLVGEWLYRTWGAPYHGLPVTFGATTAVMILTGLTIFVRLLRSNPIPSKEPPNEET